LIRFTLRWARDLEVDHLAVEGAHIKQRLRPISNYVSLYAFDRPSAARRYPYHDFIPLNLGAEKVFKNSENIPVSSTQRYLCRSTRQILPKHRYGRLWIAVRSCEASPSMDFLQNLRPPKLEDVSRARQTPTSAMVPTGSTPTSRSRPSPTRYPSRPGYLCVGGWCAHGPRASHDSNRTHPSVYYFSVQSAAYAIKRGQVGTTSDLACITIPTIHTRSSG